MKNRMKPVGIAISAILLISGCSEGSSPASLTTTSASEPITGTAVSSSVSVTESSSAAAAATSGTAASVTSAETTEAPAETTADTTVTETVTSTATAAETTAPETSAAASETEETEPKPTEDDIYMYLETEDDVITANTGNLTLVISYIGNDETAGYYTGVDYAIDRLTGDGWKNFPFTDDVSWIEIAYEISPASSAYLTVTIDDEFYAEPFTPGTYRVRKNIGGSEYYAEFDIAETNNEIEMYDEQGILDLRIGEINDDSFMCYDIIPLPYTYYVMCDTSEYSEYCVGDQIEVSYYKYYYADEDQYTMCVFPDSIEPSYTQLDPDLDYKPVIYLYPEEKTDTEITLDYNGTLTLSDPQYGGGWEVTAYPGGTLISGGKKYPYLFWEGRRNYEYDTSSGFCVSGAETEEFLAGKLAYLGLNDREAAEFMEFWLPYMENNQYNVITFAGSDYTDNAVLSVSPAPDTVIRVFMVFSPSGEYVDIPAQTLERAPDRNGFTVVEWGGAFYE